MYYPPPRGGSNSTGVIILLVIVVMCCMFVMPALGFGAWTLFKKDDKEETSDDTEKTSGPQLTFDQDATKTINENEDAEPTDDTDDTDQTTQVDDSTTSTYKIEYAGGGDGSNAIDLTLSWTNGTGFDEVKKLVFVRSIDGVELQKETTEDATATSNDSKGSITFEGTNIKDEVDSAIGTNKVEAFAYDSEDKVMSGGNALATVTIEITQDDLDQTYEGPYGDLTIPVTLSSETMKLDKIIKKTYYSISHAPGFWFEIEKSGDKVKFKRKNGMYLGIGGVDEFQLQKYKGRLVIMNNNKIYVPGKGMKDKTSVSTNDYWLAQCDLMGASLIVEDGTVRQNVEFVSPNKKYFAIYKSDGNFNVYMGSGSGNNTGMIWTSDTEDEINMGMIQLRSFNSGERAQLRFINNKAGTGNPAKSMSSKEKGVGPYKLLLSDAGRLIIADSNGKNMQMSNGGYNLDDFIQSTHGGVCGNDLSHQSAGNGNWYVKQNICADKCMETEGCIGFMMNDNTCFLKNADFLVKGTSGMQACDKAHGKTRLDNRDAFDAKGFRYKVGACEGLNPDDADATSQCPGKLSPEACINDTRCLWQPKGDAFGYLKNKHNGTAQKCGKISGGKRQPCCYKASACGSTGSCTRYHVNGCGDD